MGWWKRGKAMKIDDGHWFVKFDSMEINIPNMAFHTIILLKILLLLPIKIEIMPKSLKNIIDYKTT